MQEKSYVILESRGLIAVSGGDARSFLQGLVSNDVEKAAPGKAIHTAFLTAQGKYLHDFFIIQYADGLLLDCEGERLEDLKKRLTMYKLRADAQLDNRTDDLAVVAIFGEDATELADIQGGGIFPDPRLSHLGWRAILPREDIAQIMEDAGYTPAAFVEYDKRRIASGIADGSRDMVVEKAILLENGFDEMGSIDWEKGCYLGQELTARTNYRGLIRKRLLPVDIDGPPPEPGTIITLDGKKAGEMRSSVDNIGLALLRLEYMEENNHFISGEAKLTAHKPEWMKF